MLEEIKSQLNQNADDSEILLKLETLKQALEDLLFVKSKVQVETETADDFEFEANLDISKDLKDLQQSVSTLETQVSKLKSELKEALNKKKEFFQNEILNAHDYSKFRELLLQTKEKVALSIQLEHEQMEMNRNLSRLSFVRSTLNHHVLRVHARDIHIYQEYLINVQRLMAANPKYIEEKQFYNNSLKQNALDYFTQNMSRMKDLFMVKQDLGEKYDTLQELLRIEKELDFVFAKAMAELQGGQSDTDGVFRCFSKLEMSVYSFYMNVTQVVVSKSVFYGTFMASLDTEYKTSLMKKMYQDLEQRVLENPRIIDPYGYGLVENGTDQWVLNYSILYNQKLDIIFSDQLDPSEEEFSIIRLILDCAGITLNFAFEVVKKKSMGEIFKKLTKSILSVFSIVTVDFVVLKFLVKLLEHLTNLFTSWLGSKIGANPWIMKAFNEGKIGLLGFFSKSDMEYLDVEDSLRESLLLEEPESVEDASKGLETIENYRQLFYQMVEVESCYDVALYNQEYQNIFI